MKGTDLHGVSMDRAHPGGITLPTGETLQEYTREVVPALLTAGGKTLEQLVATGAWDSHDRSHNPIAVAFDCDWPSETGVPRLLRPRAEQFTHLFDAGLIPCPIPGTRAEDTK